MMPKSGNCFSEKIMRLKKHDPESGSCFSEKIMRLGSVASPA